MIKSFTRSTTFRGSAARSALVLAALAGVLGFGGCKAHHRYPDLTPGSHSADYGVVFGRVQRVAQSDPKARPVWIIRYGYGDSDKYAGRLNLFPDAALAGYNGGELVEVRGAVAPEYGLEGFPGVWYRVREISMWPTQTNK